LPNVTDADVVGAFLAGTTFKELVHELGQKGPRTTRELLDIATNFAFGEEVGGLSSTIPRAKRSSRRTPVRVAPTVTPKRRKRASSRARTPLWVLPSAKTP
jgi:hypothetical protein